MRKYRTSFMSFTPVLVLPALPVIATNVVADEGKDHPLIKRYPGSEIRKSQVKDYDEVEMPTGKS